MCILFLAVITTIVYAFYSSVSKNTCIYGITMKIHIIGKFCNNTMSVLPKSRFGQILIKFLLNQLTSSYLVATS